MTPPTRAADARAPHAPPPTPRSITANYVALTIAHVAMKALGLAMTVVLTRAVSVEEYGRFAFAFAFAALFLPLGDFGIDFHVTRTVSRRPEVAGDYLGASLVLKALLLPALAVASLAVAFLMGYRSEVLTLIACAVLAGWLTMLGGSYLAVFRGARRMDLEAIASIAARGAALALTLAALWAGGRVVGVAMAQVAGAAIGLPLAALLAARRFPPPRPAATPFLWREMLTSGLAYAATALLVMVYFRIDMLMLARMSGDRSVGLYGAGASLMFAGLLLSQALVGAVFPVVAQHRTLADAHTRALVRRAMKLSLLASLPLAVGACVVPGPVLALLFGEPYAAGARAFTFLMLTLPVLFVTNLIGNCLGALGRQRDVLVISLVNAALNVGLNLVLIPRFDLAGAALATLATELAGIAMFAALLRRDFAALFDRRDLGALLASSAALLAILLVARGWPLAAVLALGVVAWTALAFALRLLRADELRTMVAASLRPAA